MCFRYVPRASCAMMRRELDAVSDRILLAVLQRRLHAQRRLTLVQLTLAHVLSQHHKHTTSPRPRPAYPCACPVTTPQTHNTHVHNVRSFDTVLKCTAK